MTQDTCDFCQEGGLEPAYRPARSPRGLGVYLCTRCGLVQSLPRIDHVAERPRAISAGADWGNVRYGKAFRTEKNLALINRYTDLTKDLNILDVGSSRGAFVEAFNRHSPQSHIVAIEPDQRVMTAYAGLAAVEFMAARIEELQLSDASFDLIHSCHTLEHLRSPWATLKDHWRVLKPGGLLFAEVPNLALIGELDLVEEWFIDKHLYHYSAAVFASQIEAAGFRIVVAPDPKDTLNLTVLAEKVDKARSTIEPNPGAVAATKTLLAAYTAHRAQAHAALGRVARRLHRLADRPLAIWGAGRLLHALIEFGGFDPGRAACIVDSNLAAHDVKVCGHHVHAPEFLRRVEPAIIIVMSRAFVDEIRADAKRLLPQAEILGYGDLIRSELVEA